jgi:hypothetical protein
VEEVGLGEGGGDNVWRIMGDNKQHNLLWYLSQHVVYIGLYISL